MTEAAAMESWGGGPEEQPRAGAEDSEDPFAAMDVADDGLFQSARVSGPESDSSVVESCKAWVEGVVSQVHRCNPPLIDQDRSKFCRFFCP